MSSKLIDDDDVFILTQQFYIHDKTNRIHKKISVFLKKKTSNTAIVIYLQIIKWEDCHE